MGVPVCTTRVKSVEISVPILRPRAASAVGTNSVHMEDLSKSRQVGNICGVGRVTNQGGKRIQLEDEPNGGATPRGLNREWAHLEWSLV